MPHSLNYLLCWFCETRLSGNYNNNKVNFIELSSAKGDYSLMPESFLKRRISIDPERRISDIAD